MNRTTNMKSRCICQGSMGSRLPVSGCGSRLCRNLRKSLQRMSITRYAADEFLEADRSETVICGSLCGLLTVIGSETGGGGHRVQGVSVKRKTTHLTVVSCDIDCILAGDEITCGDMRFLVEAQASPQPNRFTLRQMEQSINFGQGGGAANDSIADI